MAQMEETSQMRASFVSRYVAATAVLFVLWALVTGLIAIPGDICPAESGQEVLAGLVLAALLGFWAADLMTVRGLAAFSPARIGAALVYLPVFFLEVIKANLDVAYRVVHPAMPIRPGIVAVRTSLKTDLGKLMLANSITLTPGTLTVDVVDDVLFIHWINVTSEDIEGATEAIVAKFEKYIRKIVE